MYKVLLIEDEIQIRSGLRTLVEDVASGFKVIGEAGNGKEALAILHKGAEPDVVITDIRMKEMNGIELIGRLRNDYPKLPVLIISGYSDFQYAQQAIRYGVAGYLLKPVDRMEFMQYFMALKAELDAHNPNFQTGEPQETQASGKENRYIIRRVKQLILDGLDHDLSLQSIADQVHLNHQYLSVLFKNETGQNFFDYVIECRMNKAKKLLKETNLKIYEVAEMSGYASSKHFMSVFKHAFGVTPTQYREQQIQ
ncbi:AraC family transcriptional regulator [Paenibacillus swuensis]|uniref:AraC family transcriptional regulator n=1 Tax=Paenibacillus swuensis TaxID=1178515 RepID=A0A172TDS7_9BACL|nr:response regulator [Paenibacillus swuensis]ANE45160.1 AraC family transcriptional regulator [Paenibacillus swuensis]